MQLIEFWFISYKHYKWLKMAMWFPFWRFNSLYNGMSITPNNSYTFLDSGFSTLITYRNDFIFSEDFCMISLCKLTCLKPREISIMDLLLYKYHVVTSFVSFLHFHGGKDNHTIYFLCVQNGWAGGRWSSLRKLYGRNHNLVDRIGISVSQMTTICSTCRKHFPVLSSFMTYLSLLIKKTIGC
jgi:hypothetical protein